MKGGFSVLLIEDDPADAGITERALQDAVCDCDVKWVRDGIEALEYLYGSGPHFGQLPARPPALVLLDIRLPRMEGIEFIRRIRSDEELKLVPIVALSSSAQVFDTIRAYDAGVNGYVVKPVNYEEFVRKMRALVEFWFHVNEGPQVRG